MYLRACDISSGCNKNRRQFKISRYSGSTFSLCIRSNIYLRNLHTSRAYVKASYNKPRCHCNKKSTLRE